MTKHSEAFIKQSNSSTTLLKNWKFWVLLLVFGIFISLFIEWISSGFKLTSDWVSIYITFLIACGLIIGGWNLIKNDGPPRRLGWIIIISFVLRAAVGILWFVFLPVLGHGSPQEQSGYIMADASERDQAAYKLADSQQPLWNSFGSNKKSDQYGGMLFVSALIYRYLGGNTHRPLQIVLITAAVSSLAVLFTWAFAKKAWSDKTAWIAAVILTVYPEAVLLGSSQMREAFTMAFTMSAFYGYLLIFQDRSSRGWSWLFGSLLICLPFSPLYTAFLLLLFSIMFIPWLHKYGFESINKNRAVFLLGIISLAVVVITGVWLALKQFAPPTLTDPISMLGWWIRKSANLQAITARNASGWMQEIFRSSPESTHTIMLLVYGIVQPFLPAAIVVGSHAKIWHWIAVWRATGWALILPLLFYAPVYAIRNKHKNQLALFLSLVVWLGILIASLRGGGDLWDNPRYRASFAGLQVALAAWVIVESQLSSDPWLRRTLISFGLIFLWFIPWYLQRYTNFAWPIQSFFLTITFAAISVVLYNFVDFFITRTRSNQG